MVRRYKWAKSPPKNRGMLPCRNGEWVRFSEVEPLVEAARAVVYAPTQDILGDCIKDLADALKPFEDPR